MRVGGRTREAAEAGDAEAYGPRTIYPRPSAPVYIDHVSREKILSLEELVRARAGLRAGGRAVVFTNGCFDLMHPGHVRYLEQARGLGDALVVALNSDRAVRELKGPARPILFEAERAEVVAALGCVDFVTVFDDVSPLDTVVAVAPDVLVKGGDWGIDRIIGRDEVEGAGGRVLSLPFVDGCSTSDVIERILSRHGQPEPA
jgi:rfaE bifunctional protein nucleotidyltransferase chain/domain